METRKCEMRPVKGYETLEWKNMAKGALVNDIMDPSLSTLGTFFFFLFEV